MNYKYLLKNKEIRLKILKLLDFVPDKMMVYIQYYISTGRWLNLSNPKRYTEKLQWYKLNYRDKLLTQCADKYKVREYVSSKGLDNILIPLHGVYNDAEDINFDLLPKTFVLKTTNGSHTNILCKDKNTLDTTKTKTQLNQWLNDWVGKMGREWAYYDIEPKIVCEEFLNVDSDKELDDYKFFCFDGEIYCLYLVVDRESTNDTKLGIFDKDFNKLKYNRNDILPIINNIEKPKNYDQMINIVKILSEDFPHVRVDLYNIDGKIYFGELTFYDGSGYKGYSPDIFDYMLGEKFNIKNIKKDN